MIWAYIELFGTKLLHGCVFVDQAPLQNRLPDWPHGSLGCYDADTLAALRKSLADDLGAFADGNVSFCSNHDLSTDLAEVLKKETLKCDPVQLGTLMSDHTQLDHRQTLRLIDVPCLNVYAGKGRVFPREASPPHTQTARPNPPLNPRESPPLNSPTAAV